MVMRRMRMMTLGFVLVLFGLQLNLIDRVELTPRFSTFLSEQGSSIQYNQAGSSPSSFSQASYARPAIFPGSMQPANQIRNIAIPDWLCWPLIFFGTVLVLQGAIKQD